MERRWDEILAFQTEMLRHLGTDKDGIDDAGMKTYCERHLERIRRWMKRQDHREVLQVCYNALVRNPFVGAERINGFLGGRVNAALMANAVDMDLYRSKSFNVEALTLEQLAGQRLMVGFHGTCLEGELKTYIDTFKIGGVVLFARNAESPDQIEELCGSVQTYARSSGQPPLFVAVDQEGGTVARFKPPFTQFPGNPLIRSEDDAAAYATVAGREMREVGCNMNLAPVLDVAPHEGTSAVAGRTFGPDPETVAHLGSVVIETLQAQGLLAVAKHFPGIGRTELDSHVDLPRLHVDPAVMEKTDLLPFAAAVQAAVAGIMMSHVVYETVDPGWPASLSAVACRHLLRGKLGFDGLVMTDDLDMGAIAKHYDTRTVAGRVLEAGIDLALICHPGPKIGEAFDALVSAFRESERYKAEALEAARRIFRAKGRIAPMRRWEQPGVATGFSGVA